MAFWDPDKPHAGERNLQERYKQLPLGRGSLWVRNARTFGIRIATIQG